MRVTTAPRTAHDIRPSRAVPTQAGPGNEQATYARLSQLARERHHLLAEYELGRRKLDRIMTRLAEVDSQMTNLRERTAGLAKQAEGRLLRRRR